MERLGFLEPGHILSLCGVRTVPIKCVCNPTNGPVVIEIQPTPVSVIASQGGLNCCH